MRDDASDPALRSWVESANDPASDFPIQNLPFGVFRRGSDQPRAGIAIGDQILDLAAAGFYDGEHLNGLMRKGRDPARAVRSAASKILRDDAPRAPQLLIPMRDVELLLPATIGDYTDFYASIHHATNVGSMFRPDNPLLPNYKWVPIGYHGRASSIVVSGTPVRRPSGQTREGDAPPSFGPSRRLDYELEVGVFVGAGNELGHPISLDDAADHVFGVCLVNDWSARDVQTWEYQPLGPFLAKNFATSVSPWIVTLDALEPFRVPAFARADGDPSPLPYLASERETTRGGIAITLEVLLLSQKMRERNLAPMHVSRGSFRDMYWTIAQLIAHHTSNGCNLQPGDLLASGTVSGATKESRGCLLERTWRGTEPLDLPTGERRAFLEDGDEVILRGWCEAPGRPRIGFGECRGMLTPAA